MTRKIRVILPILLALLLAVPAFSASRRAPLIQPGLSFSGTQANCSLTFFGDYSTDDISATIKLKRGIFTVEKWNVSDVGELVFSDTVSVSSGVTYTLTADVKINDTEYSPVSISRTCN